MTYEACRGFECVGYKYVKYPKNNGEYRGCKTKKINMTLQSENCCEECQNLNNCEHCIHLQTCKYSSVKS